MRVWGQEKAYGEKIKIMVEKSQRMVEKRLWGNEKVWGNERVYGEKKERRGSIRERVYGCMCLYEGQDGPGPVGRVEEVVPLCDVPQLGHGGGPQPGHAADPPTHHLTLPLQLL